VRLHARAGALALAAVLVSLLAAGPASATFFGRPGQISFNRFTPGEDRFFLDLFSVDPGGGGLRQLTAFGPQTGAEFSDHSPDGRTIAFDHFVADENDAPPQVWLADADGRHPRQLTDDPCGVLDPAFAPDGRTLAIDACPGFIQGIYLIPAKSLTGAPLTAADMKPVTRRTDGGFDSEPQVSPDGRWILFTRYSVECGDDDPSTECQTRIFKVRTNGTGLTQLVGPELNASAPDWHPSGLAIAFDTHDNALAPNAGHIMVALADGSHQHVIVRGDADDFYNNPSFSPDGVRISYAHWPLEPDGVSAETSDIWVARADGAHPRRVTSGAFDNKPDWGPRPIG
jgi:Tol biopolymer transport system component